MHTTYVCREPCVCAVCGHKGVLSWVKRETRSRSRQHEVYRLSNFVCAPVDVDGGFLTVDEALRRMSPICPGCGASSVRHDTPA